MLNYLVQVEAETEKRAAQKALQASVEAALRPQGVRKIGFRSGHREERIFSDGDGGLFCAFSEDEEAKIPRRWNAFGIFQADWPMQFITVEINIPLKSNGASVAGFFARDPRTGAVYLMHDGGVGGGKKGVGQGAFLAWSGLELVEVDRSEGGPRDAILVGRVDASDLPYRIEQFVRTVRAFKDAVDDGSIDTPAMQKRIEEWNDYRRENSGRRRGRRRSEIDYISYHGDIVDALRAEREAARAKGEKILNSPLVDLYVRAGSALTEVYEVKTSLARQAIYTAIGQLVTHSAGAGDGVRRVLVVPEGELAEDLARCVRAQGFELRRFRLTGHKRKRRVELI
ncbi:hypothetical protein [Sphingopyxis sp. H115]|uniref:hypothetical protein n=1 Tax=Sphingopyxis sp. H115 TaxID=1759073 RepID=UPI0007367D39|nr:hypothetical protein [Sphingopyxis sp. H115]KTE15577.1 hypothetical protein ATE71_07495 [Sphingopyxis sp. H115]